MIVERPEFISEHKAVLIGAAKTFQCELLELSNSEAVVIYRLQREVVIEGVHMPQGTISYGYFWEARNYNVYHFVTAQGKTLAFYFNVSDSTRISESQIYWRDLVLDVLVTPDAKSEVLDEHEIPEDICEDLRRLIFETRDQILERVVDLTNEIEERTRLFISQSNS